MSGATRLAGAAVAGGALGYVGALTSSPVWLLPWAVASILAGLLAGSWRRAVVAGAVLGFAIAYVFMLGVYDGSLTSALLPFLGFGAVGAGCGGLLAIAGSCLRHRRKDRDRARE